MAATQAQLRADAQELSDRVGDTSIADTTWQRWLNFGVEALWRKVVMAFRETYFSESSFTLTSASNRQTLPADFRRLLLLERNPGIVGRYVVPRFNAPDKDTLARVSYRRMGGVLVIEPQEAAAGNYKLTYTPAPTLFTAPPGGDAGTIDAQLDPWSEYVGVFAAIKAMGKEEASTRDWQERLVEIEAEITAAATDPDDGSPNTIVDVTGEDAAIPWWAQR